MRKGRETGVMWSDIVRFGVRHVVVCLAVELNFTLGSGARCCSLEGLVALGSRAFTHVSLAREMVHPLVSGTGTGVRIW